MLIKTGPFLGGNPQDQAVFGITTFSNHPLCLSMFYFLELSPFKEHFSVQYINSCGVQKF